MSKLADLMSKKEEFTFSNGTKVMLAPAPLSVKAEFGARVEKEERVKAILYLVKETLKLSIPDASEAELENLNDDDFGKVGKAILTLNKLLAPEDEKKKSNTTSASEKELNSDSKDKKPLA